MEISAERFLTLPATDHLEWETRLNRRLLRIEQELQHYFARLQGQFRGLAGAIGREGGPSPDVDRLFRSQGISGDVTWLEAATRKTHVCSDESQLVSQMLGSKLVGQILDDALDQMLDGSGLLAGGREKKRRLLSFQDIAGEGIPLGEVFRHRGKVVRLQLEDSDAYCICDQVQDTQGGVLGLLLLSNASNRPITRNKLRHKLFQSIWDIPPIRIFRISSGMIIPDFQGDRARLLAMAPEEGQGRAGGSTHLQIDGLEHLAVVQAKPSVRRETLAATVPLAEIQTNTRTLQGLTGAVLLTFVGTLLGAGFLLVRRITRPIKDLHDGAERVTAGRIETTVPVQGRDELGQLAHAFNQMTEGMRQRERMRRFLSPEVWRNTEEGETGSVGRRCRVCVLFSDLRGFTTLSERYSPQETVAMLNDYFTTMDGVLRRHGGYIDKLIGDAILAVFLPDPERADPALRAIHAGLDMRQALVAFNRAREERGEFPIQNGIGIHVDEAILGRIGPSVGRQDLTVIGPLTSVAARLESLSKHGRATRVLISHTVREFLAAFPPTGGELAWESLTVEGETGFEITSPAIREPLP
jgi:class 3 adenylate cyclase